MELGISEYALWLIGGLILCAAETLVPGAFLIWIGAAALAMGVALYLVPMGVTAQLFLFAALVVGLVLLGRFAYGAMERRAPAQPLSRAHGMIGKTFFLDSAIERGFGRIKVGDSVWRVAGADRAAGAQVRVTGVGEGGALQVEAA